MKPMYKSLVACVLLTVPLCSEVTMSEEEVVRQIHAFFSIHDYQGARRTLQHARNLFSDSEDLKNLEIRAISESGDAKLALSLLPTINSHEALRKQFHLIEALAWNHLTKGSHLSQMETFAGLYGASMTGDAKAVSVLLQALRSSNAYIRYMTLRMLPRYTDKVLQDEVLKMALSEKNWFVRLGIIEAIGSMRIQKGKEFLQEVIESRRSTTDERASAIQSYVFICDEPNHDVLEKLLGSKRAPLRQLGVALISHYEEESLFPKLFQRLEDYSPEVRMNVLVTLGTLSLNEGLLQKEKKRLIACMEEENPYVSMLASWVLLKIDSERAIENLEKWARSPSSEKASYAACLLGNGGARTAMVVQRLLDEITDSYVQINLALGMIYQQTDLKRATKVIADFLGKENKELMWRPVHGSGFSVVSKSSVRHVPYMAQYPTLVDQMTRLDLLNMLSIAGYEGTQALVRDYLQKKAWGVSASAAGLMLGEGDMDSITVIRTLLEDKDPKMRLQAALAIAFFGKDASVLPTLLESYEKVDWEKKLHILEALGYIGNRDAIPFLLTVMKNGTPLLQKIASGSVIQCLYH